MHENYVKGNEYASSQSVTGDVVASHGLARSVLERYRKGMMVNS